MVIAKKQITRQVALVALAGQDVIFRLEITGTDPLRKDFVKSVDVTLDRVVPLLALHAVSDDVDLPEELPDL